MRRSLPKFEQIEAFIAAADAASFRTAATRCSISPSALSRRIRALTDHIGVPLFERTAIGPRLTDTGRRCRAELEPAYLALRGTADRLGADDSGTVTVSLSHSLAVGWLFARLPAFRHAHPAIDLRVKVDRTASALRRGEADVAICLSDNDLAGLDATRLLDVAVLPVASPALARRVGGRLDAAPLLVTTLPHDAWAWWSRASGVQFAPGAITQLELLHGVYEAAAQGLGVALAATPTVTPHLQDGRLVTLDHAACAYPEAYMLAIGPAPRRSVGLVRSFLNDQAAQTRCAA